MASVSAYTAPLLAEYSARCGSPAMPATEQVLTIAAWPGLGGGPAQVTERGPAGADDAEHVDVQDAAPLVVGVVLDRAGRPDAGVVDQDVQAAAERGGGLADRAADRFVVGHVGDHTDQPVAGMGHFAVENGDVRAPRGEHPGRRKSDA